MIEEDKWCHYSGMPSPLAYGEEAEEIYNEVKEKYNIDKDKPEQK